MIHSCWIGVLAGPSVGEGVLAEVKGIQHTGQCEIKAIVICQQREEERVCSTTHAHPLQYMHSLTLLSSALYSCSDPFDWHFNCSVIETTRVEKTTAKAVLLFGYLEW